MAAPPVTVAQGVAITAVDYLTGGRPDLYLEATSAKSSIVRDPRSITGHGVGITLLTIAASAFIFVTIVAWFFVLQVWLDTKLVSEDLYPTAVSRLYYAILTTIISFVMLLLFFAVYRKWTSS